MPLNPGSRLTHYEILSPLGAGGMGEVYRARDTKLNRDVAIKVLPAGLGNDADYLARFQREAQALAALHHPNIATIFGLEQNAIVMELVEGQNPKGPLPLNDALNIARQIAEALEAAHDKGIIHRDLKPGNVIVTPEGVVKVLDFGLAKTAEKSAGPTTADSPTLTMRATEAGLILGTAGYMSPEQAAGKPVDRRADIWSFGVVLHELLTGKRLFHGETVSHTLAHVLTADIDVTKIPAGPIRDLIRRCLDRNLKTRLRDIGEARIAIESYLAHPPTETKVPTRTSRWPWAIAAVCLLAAGAAWMRQPAEAPALPTKFTVEPPEGGRFTPFENVGGSAISPDGRTIAFVATTAKGETLLHVRSLDSLEARALPGTDDAARPFWSPNSKTLAFVSRGKLKRIELAGGGPSVLCDVKFGRGGAWNESDVILFGEIRSGLQRVPASGGTPSFITRPNEEAGEQNHYFPQFLPDGKRFLFLVRNRDAAKSGIFVSSLDGESARRIVQTQNRAIYDAASGRLLFVQADGTLMAQRLDLDSIRLTGDAAPIADMGSTGGQNPNGYANFSVAGNGTLLYAPEAAADLARIAWRDRSGKLLEAVGQPLPNVVALSLSPDRRRLAFTTSSAELAGIPILDMASGLVTRLTLAPTLGTPQWSPDGKQIYYYFRDAIRRRAADGSGEEEVFAQGAAGQLVTAISPDGKYLLTDGVIGEVRVYPLAAPMAERKPEPALQIKARGSNSFSPDGRWLALASDESGRNEVYVQGFPDRRGRWPVSAAGGNFPTWRGDGKELYWLAPDGTLMAASVELQESSVRVGRAEPLFRLARPLYQPSADGRRFLVLDPVGDAPREKSLVVVQNWAAGLAK